MLPFPFKARSFLFFLYISRSLVLSAEPGQSAVISKPLTLDCFRSPDCPLSTLPSRSLGSGQASGDRTLPTSSDPPLAPAVGAYDPPYHGAPTPVVCLRVPGFRAPCGADWCYPASDAFPSHPSSVGALSALLAPFAHPSGSPLVVQRATGFPSLPLLTFLSQVPSLCLHFSPLGVSSAGIYR